jgi:hypothetical protein
MPSIEVGASITLGCQIYRSFIRKTTDGINSKGEISCLRTDSNDTVFSNYLHSAKTTT